MSLCMSWILSSQNYKIKNSTNICHYVYMYVLTTKGNPRIYISTNLRIHENRNPRIYISTKIGIHEFTYPRKQESKKCLHSIKGTHGSGKPDLKHLFKNFTSSPLHNCMGLDIFNTLHTTNGLPLWNGYIPQKKNCAVFIDPRFHMDWDELHMRDMSCKIMARTVMFIEFLNQYLCRSCRFSCQKGGYGV